MKKLLICAAVPREVKYIRKNLSSKKIRSSAAGLAFTAQTASIQLTLLQTGSGIKNAESSIGSFLKEFRPDLILSLGFGGALHEGLAAGELVRASRIIFLRDEPKDALSPQTSDISLPEPNLTDFPGRSMSLREGCIVTLEHPMTKPEIRNILPDGIPFPVCDMETFALATTAVRSQIPFFAVRAITDTSYQEIPREVFDLIDSSGKTSYARLLISVLKKPGLVKTLIWLGLNSEKAAKSLGDLVKSVLESEAILCRE
ncbi:MAG TPA: hypothetical protein VLD55_04425 [Candidatus Sulfobium mesophilum]|nr:hypothetical protein [Candidatus Sulfobium mesophilum]